MKSLILADIHANLAALEAVLDRERAWDEVVFLGDAVVAGPQPDEVLSRLSSLDDEGYLNAWKESYRRAVVPARYGVRDLSHLRGKGYR